ncbi:unnamed protein product [Victoria cruziana]
MNSCLQFKISKSFKQQLQQIPIQLSSKNGLSTVLLLLGISPCLGSTRGTFFTGLAFVLLKKKIPFLLGRT